MEFPLGGWRVGDLPVHNYEHSLEYLEDNKNVIDSLKRATWKCWWPKSQGIQEMTHFFCLFSVWKQAPFFQHSVFYSEQTVHENKICFLFTMKYLSFQQKDVYFEINV